MALAIDVASGKTGNVSGLGTFSSNAFSTTAANEVIVAIVSFCGGSSSDTSSSTVTGAGLTWTLAVRKNGNGGHFTEIWTAVAASILTSQTITCTPTGLGTIVSNTWCVQILSFTGANTTTPVGATNSGTNPNGTSANPSRALTTTAGSYVVAGGADYWNSESIVAGSGQTKLADFHDTGNGSEAWTQRTTSTTTGTSQTMNATGLGSDGWVFVAAEILAASGGAVTTPPLPTIVRQAVTRAAFW
jgi:hypothetical protein